MAPWRRYLSKISMPDFSRAGAIEGYDRSRLSRAVFWGAIGLLVLAVLAQAYVTYDQFAGPMLADARALGAEPSWRRAGVMSQWLQRDRTEYIGFLRAEIPENATVVVPSEGYGGIFRFTELMQYYLFPRAVIRCPPDVLEACLQRAVERDPAGLHIMVVEEFPPVAAEQLGLVASRYSDRWGVYKPIND